MVRDPADEQTSSTLIPKPLVPHYCRIRVFCPPPYQGVRPSTLLSSSFPTDVQNAIRARRIADGPPLRAPVASEGAGLREQQRRRGLGGEGRRGGARKKRWGRGGH